MRHVVPRVFLVQFRKQSRGLFVSFLVRVDQDQNHARLVGDQHSLFGGGFERQPAALLAARMAEQDRDPSEGPGQAACHVVADPDGQLGIGEGRISPQQLLMIAKRLPPVLIGSQPILLGQFEAGQVLVGEAAQEERGAVAGVLREPRAGLLDGFLAGLLKTRRHGGVRLGPVSWVLHEEAGSRETVYAQLLLAPSSSIQ